VPKTSEPTAQELFNLELEEKLEARIPVGWSRSLRCGTGWYPLLDELDTMISYLAPNYELYQVKEKYGTLRFYIGGPSKDKITSDIVDNLIQYATEISSITCESCGAARYGKIRSRYDRTVKLRNDGWMKTLCDPCALAQDYPIEEDVAMIEYLSPSLNEKEEEKTFFDGMNRSLEQADKPDEKVNQQRVVSDARNHPSKE
jgi:hypothetical protein